MRKIKVTGEIPLRFHLNKFEGWAMGRVFKAQRVVEAQERANVNNRSVEPLGPAQPTTVFNTVISRPVNSLGIPHTTLMLSDSLGDFVPSMVAFDQPKNRPESFLH